MGESNANAKKAEAQGCCTKMIHLSFDTYQSLLIYLSFIIDSIERKGIEEAGAVALIIIFPSRLSPRQFVDANSEKACLRQKVITTVAKYCIIRSEVFQT